MFDPWQFRVGYTGWEVCRLELGSGGWWVYGGGDVFGSGGRGFVNVRWRHGDNVGGIRQTYFWLVLVVKGSIITYHSYIPCGDFWQRIRPHKLQCS